MKLTFKDLKQQKFSLDAEPSDTIAHLKQVIFERKCEEKEKGDGKEWDPSLQKLIYSGKILADDRTIESYKVEEKGFIIIMLSKPKPAAVTSSATPAKTPSTPAKSIPATTPAAPAHPAVASSATTSTVPVTPSPDRTSAPAAFNDPSTLAIGTALEAAISNIGEMGFARDKIEEAMRAAFNNPDRAVEYLMNGIPEHLQSISQGESAAPGGAMPPTTQPEAPETATAPSAPSTQQQPSTEPENVNLFEAAAAAAAANRGTSGAHGSAASGLGGTGNIQGLDFLRNNQQFQQLRQLVQESPQMLEPILQQVGQGNPQLAALISQNPDAFLQLLAEGVDGDDEPDPAMTGLQTISVTPEEAEAINRLCGLGFNRDMVIQAYIACDRNEELTANYLVDNPGDDDEMGGT